MSNTEFLCDRSIRQENNILRNWKFLTIIMGLLILLRIVLSSRLPSYLIPIAGHDDGWVIREAIYVLKGNWLGPYDQYTLMKYPFSPLLLAFSAAIGVSFSGLNTALYCFSCFIFVESIKPVIKNNWAQLLFFAVLLFNPISYALDTGQRVYRTGMGQWQILLIFGCFIALILRSKESWTALLKWSFLCGFSLAAFLQTREDGAWIYPFVFGATALGAISVFLAERSWKKILIYFLPLLVAVFFKGVIAVANYSHYGVPILNDRVGGNYSKVAGDLYLIAPDVDEDRLYRSDTYKSQYYNIYISTIKKAFAASPTLNGVAPQIMEGTRKWVDQDHPETGQLPTDHMLFALRDGVRLAGYYQSLPKTEAFYRKVHDELQLAFKNATLVKRGFAISPLIVPLQKGDLCKALSLMPIAIKNVINFSGVSSAAVPSIGPENAVRDAGLIAGGDYFTGPSGLFLTGSGWAFSHDNKTKLTAGLYDKHGSLISSIQFQDSIDVHNLMLSKGFDFSNAKRSRFQFQLDGYDLNSGVTLRLSDKNNNFFREIPLVGRANCVGDGSFDYCFDSLKSELTEKKVYSHFVNRANYVIGIYQKVIPIVCLLAILVYFIATTNLIRQALKKQELKTLSVWLVMTGVALTFVFFMFIMCIIQATSFPALVYCYTAPAYIMLLIFCGFSLSWIVEFVLDCRKPMF